MGRKLDEILARLPAERRAKVEARAAVLIGRERSAMSEPDVVAQIDACEIVDGIGDIIMPRCLVHRARDEIVALRAKLEWSDKLPVTAVMVATPAIRAEALEEAAQLCFRANPQSNPNAMGHAIRALKDKV